MNCEEKNIKFNKSKIHVCSSNYLPAVYHIKENIDSNCGVCVDVGSCDGDFGIEMAKVTDMSVYLLDKSADSLNVKAKKIESTGLKNRVKPLSGDVHNIPMKDQSVDLVVSRDSIWFWKDPIKAFKEIYRVLSPQGIAYVEGDLFTTKVDYKKNEKILKKEKGFSKKRKRTKKENVVEKFVNILLSANIKSFAVTQDDLGLWVLFKKQFN